MNKDINIKFFLELDNLVDFLLDGLHILLFRYSGAETTLKKHSGTIKDLINHIKSQIIMTHLFALYSRRTLLSSTVWGNEPIVVVGRIGSLSFFCCTSNLALTFVARRWSEPFNAAA